MENYRLTQTGEEVQEILNGAAMQTDLTAENERAEGAEQTLQGNIDEEERRAKAAEETLSGAIGDEELRAKAAEETLGGAIDGINAKIPAAASSENKLADQDFVNSSIETATATFRGTYNLVSDLHLAVDATHAQIATLLGTVIAEADNNDYSYVLVPTSAQTPTEIASIEKYTFGANGWAFAYALNNSGFTSAQWAAINSGITSGLVAKLNALPTNTDLLALLAGKQDVLTFDDVPVEGSNNPVKSGGVHSAIDDEKTARVNAVNGVAGRVDTIEGEIPAQASSENQLADKAYVNSSISTNTATYRGSFNLVADLGLSVSATHEQIGTALAGEISTADNNDYAYVQVPTSDETPSQILKVERYKFNGTAWAFEYELNNSGFTSAQWAALNSGITSGLVGKLNALPTNDELTLALDGKQDVLTFDNTPTENSNNPVKSGGVYAADKALSDAIEAILLLIPSAATSLNKLVDTDLMNSSISTATATFRGTFNLVSDLSLDLTATHAQIATALAGAIATADNNDYAFVQVPTAVGTPTEIAQTDRYKFNGTAWAYEYTLNTSGFTSAQWAAINSGITAALVASLADIPDLIPSEATSANQLADKAYVLAQILAATPAFKGQFVTLAELQAVASPKAGDLGIVRTKDSDGMDVFTVYQYLNNAWNVFYSLSYHPQTKPATTGTTGDYPYNGMGRVELAKNMVNTGTDLDPVMVNQLTQDMFYKGAVGSRVPNTNTIFVIRYDYVLGEDITVPANCVLEFDGGSISGSYTLTGANTGIKAGLVKIFDITTTIAGTWNVAEAYPEWFGAKGDGITDDREAVQKAIDAPFNDIYLLNQYRISTYYDSENKIGIHIPGDKRLIGIANSGYDVDHAIKPGINVEYNVFIQVDGRNVSFKDILVFCKEDGETSCVKVGIGTTDSWCPYMTLDHVYVIDAINVGFKLRTFICTMTRCLSSRSKIGYEIGGTEQLGHGTTLTMINCYAFSCAVNGYLISRLSYSSLISCAADGCGLDNNGELDYAYNFEYCRGLTMSSCGQEGGGYSMCVDQSMMITATGCAFGNENHNEDVSYDSSNHIRIKDSYSVYFVDCKLCSEIVADSEIIHVTGNCRTIKFDGCLYATVSNTYSRVTYTNVSGGRNGKCLVENEYDGDYDLEVSDVAGISSFNDFILQDTVQVKILSGGTRTMSSMTNVNGTVVIDGQDGNATFYGGVSTIKNCKKVIFKNMNFVKASGANIEKMFSIEDSDVEFVNCTIEAVDSSNFTNVFDVKNSNVDLKLSNIIAPSGKIGTTQSSYMEMTNYDNGAIHKYVWYNNDFIQVS